MSFKIPSATKQSVKCAVHTVAILLRNVTKFSKLSPCKLEVRLDRYVQKLYYLSKCWCRPPVPKLIDIGKAGLVGGMTSRTTPLRAYFKLFTQATLKDGIVLDAYSILLNTEMQVLTINNAVSTEFKPRQVL
jgi:hypothetical protein